MYINSIEVKGKFNASGGLSFFGLNELKNFALKNKNHNFVASFKIMEGGKALINYYYKMILPQFQKAYNEKGERLFLNETDEKLRALCPYTVDEETGELKEFYSLSGEDAAGFIEFLKQYGSENLNVFIYD